MAGSGLGSVGGFIYFYYGGQVFTSISHTFYSLGVRHKQFLATITLHYVMQKKIYRISHEGNSSYNKILHDTKLALYLVGPLLLIVWLVIGLIMFEDLISRIIILLPIISLIIYGFFITRLFTRGELILSICKLIRLDTEFSYFESLKWFHLKSRTITINYDNMEIRDTSIQILKDNYEGVIIVDNSNKNEIILLEKFFQDYEEIIAELKNRMQIKTASA